MINTFLLLKQIKILWFLDSHENENIVFFRYGKMLVRGAYFSQE